MLWMVSRNFSFSCAAPGYCVRASIGIMAVCQSLQWTTSGAKSRLGIASSTARQKKAYCSISSYPPRYIQSPK